MWSAKLCSARALTSAASPGRVASMGLKSRVRTCTAYTCQTKCTFRLENVEASMQAAGGPRSFAQKCGSAAGKYGRKSARQQPPCAVTVSPKTWSHEMEPTTGPAHTHHPADAAGEGAVGAGEGAQALLMLLQRAA